MWFSWTGRKYKYKALRTAWLVSKVKNTHSEYVVLIALPLVQWLQKRVSLLRYVYIDCLVQKQLRCLRYPNLILPKAQKLVVVQLPQFPCILWNQNVQYRAQISSLS